MSGSYSLLGFAVDQVSRDLGNLTPGESLGDDPSEATSKRSGSPLPSYIVGRRWSLRQAARRLLDEPSEEEGDEEEGSSPGEMDPLLREKRALFGNHECRPVGSSWVACSIRQSDIHQMVEEFLIPPRVCCLITSELMAGLRFPILSFFCEVSRELQVPLNQLVLNSIRILVDFSVVLRYNNLIPTFGLFSQCFKLKRTEPGVFHFAPRRGVSFLPTPSPPKQWKGDFFFILPPRPWIFPHRWIYESPPAVQVSLADRFFNFCGLLDKLNEWPYDCSELTEETLLSHFCLSPCIVPLQEPLDDIMFSKHLKDEHRDATTPPTTRSSKGTPSSSDPRGKRAASAMLGSFSKKPRPSSSGLPPSRSARHISTAPPPPLPPTNQCARSSRSPSSPARGGVYNHSMLSLEKDGVPGRVMEVLKGAPSSEDKRLMSSLSSEDLDRMLSLVLVKATMLRGEILSRPPGEPSHAQGEAYKKKLEDRVECLLGEVAELKE
ncbi:UNVERIFIED_CONTAM: hypothetical protein Slati_2921300 [Sesamum latifolium]|uniref:Uncharacterized protein n=1 Tax=Sesamum latifolium TaxID=2727402 RepID=A0AAW2VCV4_9LAMI